MLLLTDSARRAIGEFIKNADKPVAGLRVSVLSGGCSGMQYGMSLEASANSEDSVLSFGELKVFVDPESEKLLDGATVDFLETMEESGFRFINPNATASCGCGKSFSA
ncbi:MAG: iron-sulfur cluster assembly accessory protein [Gammaproteobacteria bacterium]|nr:iron-sulfur cluster assembly accessory protein [Gammaproteobacteria bacterium]